MSAAAREALKSRLDDATRADFEWLLRELDGPSIMPLFGYITATAVEHQDWTFWQVLAEARKTFRKIIPV